MCLSLVTHRRRPSEKVYKAYKELYFMDKDIFTFPFSSLGCSMKALRGKWLKADRVWLKSRSGSRYLSGFHCYRGPVWLVGEVEVLVRGVRVLGKQVYPVLVSNYLYVPKVGEDISKYPLFSL